MDTNINISTINRYFSRKKEKQISNVRTKIVNNSYFSINEANISHKISKIPYYSNFFSILDIISKYLKGELILSTKQPANGKGGCAGVFIAIIVFVVGITMYSVI